MPLKNDDTVFQSVIMNINKTLTGDDNKEDDNKKDNNGNNKEEYPIKLVIEGRQDSIIIIKSKLQAPWSHNYKDKWYNIGIKTLFYFVLPFLVASINLIGIFQIISVMNALFKVWSNAFLSYFGFEDKEDDLYNFYSFYFKESINEGLEFDLIETMSFLGMIFYEFYGYKISSLLFIIPNGFSFFLIYKIFSKYDDASDQNNLIQIFYIFTSWVLLFIGVGSSALLTQQMLTDNYGKFNSFLNQVNDEDDKNNNNFIFICLTSMFGALNKYILDISISYKKYIYDQKYNFKDFFDINNNITVNNSTDNEINNIIFSHDKFLFFYFIIPIYALSIILSILFYYIFQCIVYKDDDESEIEILGREDDIMKFGREIGGFKEIYKPIEEEKAKDELKKVCKFFGYKCYFNKRQKDKCDSNKEEKTDGQINNDDAASSEQEKEEGKNQQRLLSIDYLENKRKKLNCLSKTYKIICGCLCTIFFYFKMMSNSLKNCVNKIICYTICCGKEVNLCCCCFCCECFYDCKCCSNCCYKCKKKECYNTCIRQVKEEDYKLNERHSFFCYKYERNLKWFDNFIKDKTQFKFIPLLVEFFLVQLNTLVFDIKVDENNEEGNIEFIYSNRLGFIFALILIVIIFLCLTFCFGLLRMYLNNKISGNPKECCNIKLSEVSNIILNGTIGIVIINSFYSLFAFYCLTKGWENNFLFYIPILMNKFYYFIFTNHCTVYTDNEDEEIIDYFSSATLLSIYLFIWDQIINLMKKLPIKFLLYVQIVISSIIIFIFILSLLILMICMCKKDNCCVKFIYVKFIKIEEEDTKIEDNNNISEEPERKGKSDIKFYNFPPLVGLNKVNYPNYINSTLQCLSQTEPLTNYFLQKSKKKLSGEIAKGYSDLIDNLWSKNIITASFDPNSFIEKIEKRNQSFKLGPPGYYKEFIMFILDNIHNDLKKNKNQNNLIITESPNEYDQKDALDYYKQELLKEASKISDIFVGTTETKGSCSKFLKFSKGIPFSYKYEKFNYLIFPLEKIYRNYNLVTIDDCFKYYQKEKLGFCNYCKEFDSKQTSKIYVAPNVLVLILDRGEENLSNVKLEFKETIDITQFVIAKEKDKDKITYNLYAVLTHVDQNHFVAFCKSPVNKKWYRFDDDKVNLIEDYKESVIKSVNPDILFYQNN